MTLHDFLRDLNDAAYAAHSAARGTPASDRIKPLLRMTDDLVDQTPRVVDRGTSAHTPGPWWVSGKGTIRAGKANWVARCDWFNNRANARLIAAAPELLSALTELCEQVEEYEIGDPNVLRAARAVIARVEAAE